MPQIFKIELKPEIPRISEKRITLMSYSDQMYGCVCQHLNTGHYLCYGKCYYDGCDCEKFKSIEMNIEITITNADLFEHDVSDHSERDSLVWYSEFELWRNKNENKQNISPKTNPK